MAYFHTKPLGDSRKRRLSLCVDLSAADMIRDPTLADLVHQLDQLLFPRSPGHLLHDPAANAVSMYTAEDPTLAAVPLFIAIVQRMQQQHRVNDTIADIAGEDMEAPPNGQVDFHVGRDPVEVLVQHRAAERERGERGARVIARAEQEMRARMSNDALRAGLTVDQTREAQRLLANSRRRMRPPEGSAPDIYRDDPPAPQSSTASTGHKGHRAINLEE